MIKKPSEKYYRLEIYLEKGAEELLPEKIYEHAKRGIWIEEDATASIVKCYPENIELFLSVLNDSGLKIKDVVIEEEMVPDYSELVRRYFRTITVSGVKIVPPWAKRVPQGSIIIDPGMAFGTGRHESTKIMIKLMQKIEIKDREVLELGCGSGILSIYASQLGARKVTAIDNDPDAVFSAEKNIKLNNIDNIQLACAALKDIKGAFDVCLANLDIRTFSNNIKGLRPLVKKNGHIIISGILKKDRRQILELFCEFTPLFQEQKNSWIGMVLR